MKTRYAFWAGFLLVNILACTASDRVQFVEGENQIDVLVDGKPLTSYRWGGSLTKPVLYPLFTPAGIKVTRGFPFEKVEGEAIDHPHHTGLFFTYDQVNGNGFWNNTIFPPRIVHTAVQEMYGGKEGVLATESLWLDKKETPLLQEKRRMVFIPGDSEVAIDFSIRLTALVDSVVFEDTKEGMFAVRVAHWLREEDQTGQYLSSNGDIGEKAVWGKRAEWVRLAGQKEGQKVGIVIMHHPSSVNFPTFWHARAYGLFSANPLGQYVFETARGVPNAKPFRLTLKKGESALFRFRVILYDGLRSAEEIAARYKLFAQN